MAVEVTITGAGTFSGARASIGSYSVTEDSTPVDGADISGGTGQITFSAVDDPSRFGSMMLLGSQIELTDGDRGLVTGRINSVTSNDGILNVTADSRLAEMVGERTADWVDGNFEAAIRYYLGLAGITTGIAVDTTLASKPVVAIGWTGDVWTKIKELLVVHGAEISMVRGELVVRPVRGRRALEINNISESWSINDGELSEKVEVFYYNTVIRTNALVYPEFGWHEDVEVYTVDTGEAKTINIPVNAWLTSLVQPTAVDSVPRNSQGSVYSVSGNDGKPITAAQWKAHGGGLHVAIGADGMSIDLTLIGAGDASAELAPFRIAMTAGSGDYYSSLRIHGTGAVFNKQSVIAYTGAGPMATSEFAASIDNPFVRTPTQAWNIAADAAGRHSSPVRTLSITKADINKPDSSSNSYNYVTFAENDAYLADEGVTTFANFDTKFSGQRFRELDNYWYKQVEDEFDFQVFGNANGARVQYRRNMYRIRSATTTESSVNYSAEADTTFSDFDSSATGMTFTQFDNSFSGKTFTEFALAPLVNVEPQYDR